MENVRVRFAPSPTGPLHIGGLRTALYNYLFAKKNNGSFILRIEDTDQQRYVPGAEDYIFQALDWSGLKPDESIRVGGEYGSYRQSERSAQYREFADRLVEAGHAYYAFDTPQEIEAMRESLIKEKDPNPTYNWKTRNSMRNSLTMTKDDVLNSIRNKVPHVVRLKVPESERIEFTDLVRGEIEVESVEIDDKVLLKSDGLPTYHLANVVDDHFMKISHVIRGEEWLPSAPLHVLLYRYLGWEDSMPEFAHLPLLMKPDGKGKLSKRDGIKHGFPVFPLSWIDRESGENLKGFREEGFLPEAVVNFLALLGWNPGTEQEIFSIDELIGAFSIDRINKAGAKFDINKATWFNEHYVRALSNDSLMSALIDQLQKAGINDYDKNVLSEIVELLRERISFLHDLLPKGIYFFQRPESYDEKVIRKKWTPQNVEILSKYAQALSDIDEQNLNENVAKETLESIMGLYELGIGPIMQPLRVIVTGTTGGPDLMQIIKVLGSLEVAERINLAIERLKGSIKE